MHHNVSRLTTFLKLETKNPEIASDADRKGFEECSSLKWRNSDVATNSFLAHECKIVNRALTERGG